jgi:hypothetical protein
MPFDTDHQAMAPEAPLPRGRTASERAADQAMVEAACADDARVLDARSRHDALLAGGLFAGLIVGVTAAVLMVRVSYADAAAKERAAGFWSWVARRLWQGVFFTVGILMLVWAALSDQGELSTAVVVGVIFLILGVVLGAVSRPGREPRSTTAGA